MNSDKLGTVAAANARLGGRPETRSAFPTPLSKIQRSAGAKLVTLTGGLEDRLTLTFMHGQSVVRSLRSLRRTSKSR